MSRHVHVPSAFLALGLVSLSACVDAPPGEPPSDEHDHDYVHVHDEGDAGDGLIACGKLGRVEVRDGKVMQDDMVFGDEADLPELCDASVQGQLFGVGVDDPAHKWPNGVIPYRVLPHVPSNITQRISQAMTAWEGATSIEFEPYVEGEHTSWVEFDTDTSCHAHVGKNGGKQNVWLTDSKDVDEIVGVAIAANNWVYTWYLDGSVTAGTPTQVDEHKAVYKFSLPPGYYAAQIVEMAINSQDRVYTWWSDGKVSIGTSFDLDAYQAPQGNYALPAGKTRYMIVGIGISGSDTVHTWYNDGTRSMGSSLNLGNVAVAIDDVDVTSTSIRGVDFWSNNDVYTFYTNQAGEYRRVIGTIYDQSTVEYASVKVNLPRNCSVNTTIHELGHTIGLKHEQARCDRDNHVRVFFDNVQSGKAGNFDKWCDGFSDHGAYDFDSLMHYSSYAWTKNDSPTLVKKGTLGANIPKVLEMAIASDDHVYTWWEDGTVTAGTSYDLELYRARYPFTLPPGRTIADIRGIGIASDDRVYTYYVDGTVSVGTTADLDAHVAPYDYDLAYKATGVRYQPNELLAIGISDEDHVYAWYSDGYVSWGTSDNPGQQPRYSFSSPLDPDRDELKGIDIANGDHTYAWYETGRASRGATWHLSEDDTYDVRTRGTILTGNSGLSAGDIAAVNAMY
ncbi:MAG: hypothetical protein F9K40_12490 [Kofleriaceae bacterium]|nr:MAG: hypothetical protein F9K40_12490 [Kofleriaceae bacterium]MBZ0236649.1 hypothetical protein [Kofleriaceae bacterium]